MPTENPLLTNAARDVSPASSTGNNPDESREDDSANPNPDLGNDSGDQDRKHATGGRTLDEVSGEFNRKLAKLEGMIEGLTSREPKTQVVQTDINKMSAAQLEAMTSAVTEDQMPAFRELLSKKQSEESMKSMVEQELNNREFARQKRQAEDSAFSTYPELNDVSSRFRKTTNDVLNEMGPAANLDPSALLHAAEGAAQRLGLKRRQRNSFQNGPARGNTGPAGEGSGEKDLSMSEEEADRMAEIFKRAMPDGKFSKERIKSARENTGIYRKHQSKLIK